MSTERRIDGTNPTVIKVVGIGGGGSNAINRMIEVGVEGVDFIVVNTDLQALSNSKATKKIPLGRKLTGGLGAGGRPEIGEEAAIEDREEIRRLLEDSDMVFITAGMGGGTGTGAAPVIAQISKELDKLTVAVVTKPFSFEGQKKMQYANEGIAKLKKYVDTIITIPNQHLFKIVERRTTIKEAFAFADDVLRQGVQGVSDLITKAGEINIDFADVRNIMSNRGDALMGIGRASGDNRAIEAATNAINNPLLEDSSLEGAMGIIVNVSGGYDFTLSEFDEIVNVITENAHQDVLVIPGTSFDADLDGEIIVTVVATGFNSKEKIDFLRKQDDIDTNNRNSEKKNDNKIDEVEKKDFISSSEWDNLTKLNRNKKPDLEFMEKDFENKTILSEKDFQIEQKYEERETESKIDDIKKQDDFIKEQEQKKENIIKKEDIKVEKKNFMPDIEDSDDSMDIPAFYRYVKRGKDNKNE